LRRGESGGVGDTAAAGRGETELLVHTTDMISSLFTAAATQSLFLVLGVFEKWGGGTKSFECYVAARCGVEEVSYLEWLSLYMKDQVTNT
jgi:hypothetical protein